ncbi:hypothetical protein E0493_03440 [Roseomonas sp. M0104]|uniref:Glycosyltransferase family 2 protein n=1 Tax=Teichococcus coralli TaxID=2545983 RepID=A0A845B8H2_9PROT|nr:hypothetical protein [Pseudoroseomonas coralli]MXP62406.1 hypothetical protein [Pseudoroseomonas coralli]
MHDIDTPIILYSFDRPGYLERVCASLADQRGVRFDPGRIWLLQDGATSARTGRRHGDAQAIDESISVFRRYFPRGQVRESRHNLGVARNILRGERLVFEELGAELGYFFEDDLELGPWYLYALEALRLRTAAFDRVAYFAAYGDHRRDYPGPEVKYIPLEHHWGFGLRRHAWLRIMQWLAPYYALLGDLDYNDRPHRQIFELYRPLSIATEASSQDAAKSIACLELGLSRLMTTVSFGRYIGERGNSFSPEHFRNMGFDRMRIAGSETYDFLPLTEAKLDEIDGFHRRHYERLRRERFDVILAAHPPRG